MKSKALPFRSRRDISPLKIIHKSAQLQTDLKNHRKKIAVIGLGYVGLPLALSISSKFSVTGFDTNEKKIKSLKKGEDPCEEVSKSAFEKKYIRFESDESSIADASVYIISVPTPVDKDKKPNLTALLAASKTVGKYLKEGNLVIYESTVFPGCTENNCVPVLEEFSGLKYNKNFMVSYSPERINPGDKIHQFDSIIKVVSGSNDEALEIAASIYSSIIPAGVHKASSIKVAEACKVVENIQRDVNIALMNELSYLFDKENINIHQVLEAAGTKWNFLPFHPGLVGGHCISVDPYYLLHRAEQLNTSLPLIKAAREENENMVSYLFTKIEKVYCSLKTTTVSPKILIKGLTFKPNVKDIRNSKIIDIIAKMHQKGMTLTIEDPHADAESLQQQHNIKLVKNEKIKTKFDFIIIAVNHSEYKKNSIINYLKKNTIVLDITGNYKFLEKHVKYLSI